MADLKTLLGSSYKEGMTTEEITAALSHVDVVSKTDYDKIKSSFDGASSEVAAFKKVEKERKEKEDGEKDIITKLQGQVEQFKKESQRKDLEAKLAKGGYNDEEIKTIVDAMEADPASLAVALTTMRSKTIESTRQTVTQELQNKTIPKPPAPNGTNPLTKAEEYKKKLESAASPAEKALYMRLAQEAEATENKN